MGKAIRARRLALDLTMQELADRAQLSFNTVVTLEHGKALPSMKSLDAVAVALGMTSTALLRGVYPWDGGEPPPTSEG